MPLRNGEHGYGFVSKALHWGTLALMSAQFTIGYGMDAEDDRADDVLDAHEDACESENDASEERCEEAVDAREDALKDDDYSVFDGSFDGSFDLVDLHVVLGLTILALAVARTAWRIGTPLPPWDERLNPFDRRVAHATEITLIATQYVVPLSGLWLIASSDDSVLPLHIVGHAVFYAALVLHVGLVLRRGLLARLL